MNEPLDNSLLEFIKVVDSNGNISTWVNGILSISHGGTCTSVTMEWEDYLDGEKNENSPLSNNPVPQNIPLLLKSMETDTPHYVVAIFDGENFMDDMGEIIETKYIEKYSIIKE